MLELENSHNGPVCGIDEVGRGPLAGPVLAACVHIPERAKHHGFWAKVTDSKKLSAKAREQLAPQIREHVCYGIAQASREEIDDLNIHHATLLAMKRAFENMIATNDVSPVLALVDGKFGPALPCPVTTVIGGDGLSLSIAAASILAKVERDRLMAALHEDHPVYGWNSNAGYGTAAHLEAIKLYGVTIHHRRSYAPVRMAVSR